MNPLFSEETYWEVFDRTVEVLQSADLRFLVIGGIPTAKYGYPKWTPKGEDVDLLLTNEDANTALNKLEAAGFRPERSERDWMLKVSSEEVDVDLIFRPGNLLELDGEMLERSRKEEFEGRTIPMVSPEDLVVMLSSAYEEDAPMRLKNILGILSHTHLSWDYLLWRTSDEGRLRLLSFLIYADSKDILLPRSGLLNFMRAAVPLS